MDLQAYNEAFDVHDLTRPEDVLHYLEGKSQLQLEEGEQFISTELVNKVRGYFHGMFFNIFFIRCSGIFYVLDLLIREQRHE